MKYNPAWRSPKMLIGVFAFIASIAIATVVFAADTSNFTQTINAGVLTVDIVDGSYASVGSPSITMGATTFSFTCTTSTGIFGATSTQVIYVQNPDAADNGWTLTLAATDPTDVWDSAGTDMDFNDPTNSGGCPVDGGDADSVGGRMQVNSNLGIVATGTCGTCASTGISVGSSAQYSQGSTDSITILTSDGTVDIGDWRLTNILIRQAIPSQQPAASDYDINMTLDVTAS